MRAALSFILSFLFFFLSLLPFPSLSLSLCVYSGDARRYLVSNQVGAKLAIELILLNEIEENKSRRIGSKIAKKRNEKAVPMLAITELDDTRRRSEK